MIEIIAPSRFLAVTCCLCLFGVDFIGHSRASEDQEIDLIQSDDSVPTVFVSHQGAPTGFPEPPKFRISRQPAVPDERGRYYYASIFCDTNDTDAKECIPYVSSLNLGHTGIIKDSHGKIDLQLNTGRQVEHYSFKPLIFRDIDRDGQKDLVVQFRIQFKSSPNVGSQYNDYIALVKLPDFHLMYWSIVGQQGPATSGSDWKSVFYYAGAGLHAPIVIKRKCKGADCSSGSGIAQEQSICWDSHRASYAETACGTPALHDSVDASFRSEGDMSSLGDMHEPPILVIDGSQHKNDPMGPSEHEIPVGTILIGLFLCLLSLAGILMYSRRK